jgi:DNA-directed RNA polymerase subunit RPC12/RpoP
MICPVCGNKTIKGIISYTCIHCKENFFDPQSDEILKIENI